MKIRVNGEEKFINNLNKEFTLAEALAQLGYKNNTIIVELNNLIINNESWQENKVKDGDKLEIVSIVGGG
tara:strand:- start:322 stop:531 length:210 start_codon:yes stop_codon:yes gene_type:complete